MRAYASHHIPGGNERYGSRVGEYVYYLQGVDAAVYICWDINVFRSRNIGMCTEAT